MTFDPDDWRWTAYLLDELDGDDRAEIEDVLATEADAISAASLRNAPHCGTNVW